MKKNSHLILSTPKYFIYQNIVFIMILFIIMSIIFVKNISNSGVWMIPMFFTLIVPFALLNMLYFVKLDEKGLKIIHIFRKSYFLKWENVSFFENRKVMFERLRHHIVSDYYFVIADYKNSQYVNEFDETEDNKSIVSPGKNINLVFVYANDKNYKLLKSYILKYHPQGEKILKEK